MSGAAAFLLNNCNVNDNDKPQLGGFIDFKLNAVVMTYINAVY